MSFSFISQINSHFTHKSYKEFKQSFIFFGIFVLVFLFLIHNGHEPHMGIGDGRGYERFADLFFTPSKWIGKGNFETIPGITHVRLAGYPLVIFISKLLSPQSWSWILVSFQFFSHAIALWYVRSLLKDCKVPPVLVFLAVCFMMGGETIGLYFLSLTDSLFISLSLIFSTFCVKLFVRFSARDVIFAAFSLGFLFLLRESALLYFVCHLPLLGFYIFKKDWKKRLQMIYPVLLTLPLLFLIYGSWNLYRFNHFFLTTMPRLMTPGTIFQVLHDEKDWNDVVLKDFQKRVGNYPLLRGQKENEAAYWPVYANLAEVLFKTLKDHGVETPLEQKKYIQKLYLNLWKDHPVKMLWHIKEEIIKHSWTNLYRPITSVAPKGYRIAPKLIWNLEIILAPVMLFIGFGLIFFWGKIFFTLPLIFLQSGAVLYIFFYASFHIERRYVIPSVNLFILNSVFMLSLIHQKVKDFWLALQALRKNSPKD